jgi:hypothetical protein
MTDTMKLEKKLFSMLREISQCEMSMAAICERRREEKWPISLFD